VNLLNEAGANALHFRRVASFENILIVTGSNLQYQCVWNADGIIDNVATPAGISHAMWAPGQTADDLYKVRGTRACREWKSDMQETEMPLLPLQNTVVCFIFILSKIHHILRQQSCLTSLTRVAGFGGLILIIHCPTSVHTMVLCVFCAVSFT
jgi:hypothetical protein